MLSRPVDQIGRVLIRSHEQNLLLAVQIDNWVLDTWACRRKEQIHNTIDILLKRHCRLILMLDIEQHDTFTTAFRDILVLPLLRIG